MAQEQRPGKVAEKCTEEEAPKKLQTFCFSIVQRRRKFSLQSCRDHGDFRNTSTCFAALRALWIMTFAAESTYFAGYVFHRASWTRKLSAPMRVLQKRGMYVLITISTISTLRHFYKICICPAKRGREQLISIFRMSHELKQSGNYPTNYKVFTCSEILRNKW